MVQSVVNRVRQLHGDERGTVSLESIAVFAVGALVLGGVLYFWKSAKINGQTGIAGAVGALVTEIFKMTFKTT